VTRSRDALLAAGAQEFALHGRHGTRVQSIVKRAGVNERMIYHHFESKDGLYAAVLADQMHGLASLWRPILARAVGLEPYDGMRLALTGLVDVLRDRPQLVALWLHEAMGGWTTMPLPTADMLPAPLRELYERGQDDGRFRPDCPFEIAYATALCALIAVPVFVPRFAEVLGMERGQASVTDELRDRIVDQLLDGMTGPS
jgi:AcrR family transcriptional regulator